MAGMAGKIVLIGSSLDVESDAVVRAGLAWARAGAARVHVVHVVHEVIPAFAPPPGSLGGIASDSGALLAAEEERLRDLLGEQLRRLEIRPDELAGHSLLRGVPHRLLGDLAAQLDAGLLVVGASRGGTLQRLLGSTADRVLRRATCPVLVVRGVGAEHPARVLAPVDLSPLSAEAFQTGLERLAELPGNAPEIEALFVLSPMQRQVAPQFTPEQVDRFAEEELARFITAHAGTAAARVRCQVRVGSPREEILERIGEWTPELVVLGTHGLGGFDRFVIGSVAADVVREASCSVLVVPAGPQS